MNLLQPIFGSTLAACLCAGCATPGWLDFSKDEPPMAGPRNPVVQVVPLWQATRGIGLDGKSTRGFGGQIMFITQAGPLPAQVDGDVRVYLFDDQGTPEEQAKPMHQFNFSAEAWNAHACQSKLGQTYSVFIPYTRPGAHETQCSLLVRYTPREGSVVHSEMANVGLPGAKPEKPAETGPGRSGDYDADDIEVAGADRMANVGDGSKASGRQRDRVRQIAAEIEQASIGLSRPAGNTPLSREEEDRIIREARARLAAEDDFDGQSDPDAPLPAARQPRHELVPHVLSDEAEDAEQEDVLPAAQNPSGTKGRTKRSSSAARHPLSAQEESARTSPKRRETLTINLSELR